MINCFPCRFFSSYMVYPFMKLLSSKRSHHTISSWLQQIFLDKLKTTGKNNSSQKQMSWAKVSVKMLNIIAHTWRKKRYRRVILMFQIFRWLLIHNFQICCAITLPEKCLYSEFFWSVFHRIQTECEFEYWQNRKELLLCVNSNSSVFLFLIAYDCLIV